MALLTLTVISAGAGLWAYAEAPGRSTDQAAQLPIQDTKAHRGLAKDYNVPRPLGDWERQAGAYRLALHVEPEHLCVTLLDREKGKEWTAKLEADYSVTRDSVLYGVISGLEIRGRPEGETNAAIDQPFSVHFRLDDQSLTVKNLKCLAGKGGDFADAIQGRYIRVTTTLPIPRAERVSVLWAGTPVEPPDEAAVLRALPRLPHQVWRADVHIITERLLDRLDPPRYYALIGRARLRHCRWKCTVYYNETVDGIYPFPFQSKKPRIKVVYIDKDYLHPSEEQ